MLPLLLAIQSQATTRPSGMTYMVTVFVTAGVAGALVAVLTARFVAQNGPPRRSQAASEPLEHDPEH
jgi:hypothetical protein